MEERGCVQVYTGPGRSKTTVTIGLALRATGAGFRVFIGQFFKEHECDDHKAVELLGSSVTHKTWGETPCPGKASEEDKTTARRGMEELRQALTSEEYDVVIADEINSAIHMGLVSEKEVLDLIKARPEKVELVLTGISASEKIIEAADLVTEIEETGR